MRRVIIADDDPIVCGLVSSMLESAGYLVGAVSDGPSAVGAITLKMPDLAILDINMPGCSGVEALRQIRNSEGGYDIPIVMLTTRAGESDIQIAMRAGADDYLTKPFDADELMVVVERQMAGRKRAF